MIIEIVKIFVFPGIAFILFMAFFSSWMVRKIVARMENRVGPPFLQPYYDMGKLLAKQRVYPHESIASIMHLMPMIQLGVAILIALFMPVYSPKGILSFDGDVYFILFLISIHGATAYFVGWASRNPYTISGAGRAVMTEISLEIPLAVSIASMGIMTKSIRISEMTEKLGISMFPRTETGEIVNKLTWLYLIPWTILIIVAIYSAIGALELSPFSAPHAETEIVHGWSTELTGADLAMTEMADMVNLFNLSALITAIFLGGPRTGLIILNLIEPWTYVIGFLFFLMKFLLVMFILSYIYVLSGRLRIDQIISALWSYFLPLSLIGMLLVLILETIGG